MSIENNKAVVRAWFQAFNDRNMAGEEAARAADFAAHIAGAPLPLDGAGWQSFIASFVTGFPDSRLEIEDVVAEADRVAVRWTFHGTHRGEFLGIAPTAKSVKMSALEINRIAGGKIAEHWVVLQALGNTRPCPNDSLPFASQSSRAWALRPTCFRSAGTITAGSLSPRVEDSD